MLTTSTKETPLWEATKAVNPAPDQTPATDARPQYWLENSKNGDAWVMSKEGN